MNFPKQMIFLNSSNHALEVVLASLRMSFERIIKDFRVSPLHSSVWDNVQIHDSWRQSRVTGLIASSSSLSDETSFCDLVVIGMFNPQC